MQAASKSLGTAALAAAVAGWLVCSAAATAQNSSPSGCRWQTAFIEHLGIEPATDVADGDAVQVMQAQVKDPDRLHTMGLFNIRPGDRINMVCVGSDVWRIKHYATGLAIMFSPKPF